MSNYLKTFEESTEISDNNCLITFDLMKSFRIKHISMAMAFFWQT